jgi:phage tail sheath protein FI
LDPSGRSADPILLPPSGYIAGLYARTDASRGVWKAPAGTQAGLNGVVGLAADITDVQQGNLNPLSVNVIRSFTAGVVSWGARTLTADPEWRYVSVRRTAIMLRVSIYNGIQWAVFEPNDEPLWAQLRLNIGSFMTTLFRQGAFAGSTTSEAFFVKCDSDTTTSADVDRGVVNVQVGFAALKPAEFVVVTISQKAGQASS